MWGVTPRDTERLDLQADSASVGAARRFVTELLDRWGCEEAVDTVSLLTSELATNAVLHARTPFAVLIAREDDSIRVDVLDHSRVQPTQRQNTAMAATGRGVAIVARLSTAWGTTQDADLHGFSKGVWFTIPVSGVETAAWEGDWLDGL